MHNTAVQIRKDCFQRLVFTNNLLFIIPFFRHINCRTHSTHNASVNIIQRRFICFELPDTLSCHNRLFGYIGFSFCHYLVFRLYAGGIILFYSPDVRMLLPFHLFLCLVYCCTKTVIYFFVYTVFIFIPDQIRRMVNRRFQKLTCLPEILAHLTGLLPSQETKLNFFF